MNVSKLESSRQLIELCQRQLLGDPVNNISSKIQIQKLNPQGELPFKESKEDIGWDVTLVSRVDNRPEDQLNDINEFGTGLSFSPPKGYYLQIIPTNNLYRHGYMLAGPIVIHGPTKGELIVPLFKFRDVDDISLPFRAVKIIPVPAVYIHLSHQAKRTVKYQNDDYQMTSAQVYPQSRPKGNHMF